MQPRQPPDEARRVLDPTSRRTGVDGDDRAGGPADPGTMTLAVGPVAEHGGSSPDEEVHRVGHGSPQGPGRHRDGRLLACAELGSGGSRAAWVRRSPHARAAPDPRQPPAHRRARAGGRRAAAGRCGCRRRSRADDAATVARRPRGEHRAAPRHRVLVLGRGQRPRLSPGAAASRPASRRPLPPAADDPLRGGLRPLPGAGGPADVAERRVG